MVEAGSSASTDTEHDEIIGFLSDARLDVQQMAAEGVLAMSEDQAFVGFCKRFPRKVAKPLLRLVERAESSEAEATKSIQATVQELKDTKGDAQQQERAVDKAATEKKQAQEAGSVALQALVNLSAIPEVCNEIVSMNGPRRFVEAMRGGWLEGRATLAHWYAMLLANATASKAGQEALCADEGMVHFLMAAYISNPRPQPRDGYDDPLECIGKVFQNLCASSAGRRVLSTPSCIRSLVGELSDRGRRQDAFAALRNLCIDKECHERIVESALALQAATFLYPWERVDEKLRAELTEEFRKELEAKGAALTADGAVRNIAATSFYGLCQSSAGRDYLRDCDYREVLRAWEAEETDDSTKTVISQTVQLLVESEARISAAIEKAKLEPENGTSGGYPDGRAGTIEEEKADK